MTDDEILAAADAIHERRRQERAARANEVESRAESLARKGPSSLHPGFSDDELLYAAKNRCDCGAGLAYPRDCGMHWRWECSAILRGEAPAGTSHSGPFPFIFYDIKGEGVYNGTTRPVTTIAPEDC
jgi:hypothetical protein